MKILELFSGTGSVGKIAREKGWEVVSLDLKNADININILNWDYTIYEPGYFEIIWASPPCNSFSILQNALKTKEQIIQNINVNGLPILNKTLEIINYLNPKYYFIENPQTGLMKKYITDRPYYDVDYCKFADWGYRKRTRIWTNINNYNHVLCQKNCNSLNNNKHKMKNGKTLSDRYRIPPELIKSLFNKIPDPN
jgi:hypothetical protein